MKGVKKFKSNTSSEIKNIIGVVSGKGGVGKSFVSSTLACELRRRGFEVGILDADITGPSIPSGFGLTEMASSDGKAIIPELTKSGIKVISVNLILKDRTQPVLWRAPIIGNAISQFYCDCSWDYLDYLIVDMPPGTGDVSLTVFQSMDLDGVVIVSTPQDLVGVIVEKAVNMARMMQIKILGFVENMSYFKCENCDQVSYIFGKSNIYEHAKELSVNNVIKLPMREEFSKIIDEGRIEDIEIDEIKEFVDNIIKG